MNDNTKASITTPEEAKAEAKATKDNVTDAAFERMCSDPKFESNLLKANQDSNNKLFSDAALVKTYVEALCKGFKSPNDGNHNVTGNGPPNSTPSEPNKGIGRDHE